MSNKRVVKHHNVMDAGNAEGGRCDISGFMDSGEGDIDSQVTYWLPLHIADKLADNETKCTAKIVLTCLKASLQMGHIHLNITVLTWTQPTSDVG